jgi:hypothetical protein
LLRQNTGNAPASTPGRGFFVDTVGRDTEKIRRYIQEQEAEDRRLDQLELPATANQQHHDNQ